MWLIIVRNLHGCCDNEMETKPTIHAPCPALGERLVLVATVFIITIRRCPAHCWGHRRCSVNVHPSPSSCSQTSQGAHPRSVICSSVEKGSRVGNGESRGCFFPGSQTGLALFPLSCYTKSFIIPCVTCFQLPPRKSAPPSCTFLKEKAFTYMGSY